jgi:hypothetical protein
MQTVAQLIENARLCGEDFAKGKDATGQTFNSARMRSIVPAMEAIESGAVTLASNTSIARDITLAYAAGANIAYTTASETAQVSKTQAFLLAAQSKVGLSTMQAVQRVIADTNDDDTKKVLNSRVLEKMATLLRVAVGDSKAGIAPHTPDRDAILAVFAPVTEDKDKHELLADAFKKMAKLSASIAEIDPELYGKAFLQEKARYIELQATHETRAKVIKAHKEAEKAEAEKAKAEAAKAEKAKAEAEKAKAEAEKAKAEAAKAEKAKAETAPVEHIQEVTPMDMVDAELELA